MKSFLLSILLLLFAGTSTSVHQPENLPETKEANQSYGLFYPSPLHNPTINNTRPTIIGKIDFKEKSFLDTEMKKDAYFENDNDYLYFLPGRVKNLQIFIDQKPISKVYGFAKHPYIPCFKYDQHYDEEEKECLSRQRSDESIFCDTDDEYYRSPEECLSKQKDVISPLIFITKPDSDLAEGAHVLTIKSDNTVIGEMSFMIDKNFQIALQQPPQLEKGEWFSSVLYVYDYCSAAYYYLFDELRFPLPIDANVNLFYSLIFPDQSELYYDEELGARRSKTYSLDRKIYLEFEDELYDIFFPSSSIFDPERESRSGYEDLYLPEELLRFSDGGKIGRERYFIHLGILPVDISGREYVDKVIPWSATDSSFCDG